MLVVAKNNYRLGMICAVSRDKLSPEIEAGWLTYKNAKTKLFGVHHEVPKGAHGKSCETGYLEKQAEVSLSKSRIGNIQA